MATVHLGSLIGRQLLHYNLSFHTTDIQIFINESSLEKAKHRNRFFKEKVLTVQTATFNCDRCNLQGMLNIKIPHTGDKESLERCG